MVEAGGETTSEVEEEVLQEADEVEVLLMSAVEEIIKTQVIQVVRGLINQKFHVIIVINLVIMHMNAGRNNMTKEGKVQVSRPAPALRQVQCYWHQHLQSNAMLFKKVHMTYVTWI